MIIPCLNSYIKPGFFNKKSTIFYTKNSLNLPFGFGLDFAAPCVGSLGIVAAISGSINKNIRYIFGLWPSFICDYHYISSVWKGNHMVIIVIPLLKVAIITENEKVAWFKSLSFFKLITPRVRNEMEVSNSRDFRKFVNSEKLDVHWVYYTECTTLKCRIFIHVSNIF
mgnify:CR=1 FL=1